MKPLQILVPILTAMLLSAGPAAAADSVYTTTSGQIERTATGGSQPEPDNDRSFTVSANWRGLLAPGSELYPRYMADPLEPSIAIQYLFVSDSDIPDTGDSRFLFNLGGRFGLLRLYADHRPQSGFQIDVQAAFVGMFDNDNSQDNVGWDGIYGVLLTWSDGEGTAAKFGMRHDSSHRGDEYVERTGLERINYTREEVVLGLSRTFFSDLRVYAEGAYGYDLRNTDVQEPWRTQVGLEYEDDDRFWNGRMGWYTAADFNAYEENDWDVAVSIQAGLVAPIRNTARTFRFGAAYYNGRSILGEFSQFDEEYFSLGVWVDL